jgi:hypothetical protein
VARGWAGSSTVGVSVVVSVTCDVRVSVTGMVSVVSSYAVENCVCGRREALSRGGTCVIPVGKRLGACEICVSDGEGSVAGGDLFKLQVSCTIVIPTISSNCDSSSRKTLGWNSFVIP